MKPKELLEHIIKAMVDYPDQVVISEIEGSQATIIELKVAKSDLGKVIGKKGNHAYAIRAILNAVSAKSKKRITLEILE